MVSGCWEKGDSNYERVNVTTIATIVFFYLYIYLCNRQKYSRQFIVFLPQDIDFLFLAQEVRHIRIEMLDLPPTTGPDSVKHIIKSFHLSLIFISLIFFCRVIGLKNKN